MDWKTLIAGIVLIVILGVGGLVYRNAVEQANKPVACPADAKVCPDGTSVAREGLACDFPACPPPNVTLDAANVAYALPAGFALATPASVPDDPSGLGTLLAAYTDTAAASSTATTSPEAGAPGMIIIRQYAVAASSTPLATIQATALSATSGAPVPTTAYTSTNIANRQYSIVLIEQFEGVVDTAFYLARGATVLRFDALDRGVDSNNPNLDPSTLPAYAALRQLLSTLQGE